MKRRPSIGDRFCEVCGNPIGRDEPRILIRYQGPDGRSLIPGRMSACETCAMAIIEGAPAFGIGVALT